MLRWRYSRRRLRIAVLTLALGLATLPQPALALNNGSLTVLWDANTTDTDLKGYRVYLTTDAALLSQTPAAAGSVALTREVDTFTTQTTFTSLDSSRVYYVAVTCFDMSGNESLFSNVVSSLPTAIPVVAGVSPNGAQQGATGLQVTLTGSTFQSGSTVSFGPGISIRSLDTSGAPDLLVAVVDIDPLAEVDMRDVMVTNPGGASVTKSGAFEVRIDVTRVDINQSNRIDGGDMIALAAAFTRREEQPGYSVSFDLNVDGVVDALDLSLLLGYFGASAPF